MYYIERNCFKLEETSRGDPCAYPEWRYTVQA